MPVSMGSSVKSEQGEEVRSEEERGAEEEVVDVVVGWDGEDDKSNPMNWPAWKKGSNVLCLFLMSLIS